MESFAVGGLEFTYPGQTKKALGGLTFSVAQGSFVTLAGPSGCGKSTLLRQFKTVLAPHGKLSGEILFEGRPLAQIELREQAARIGFVQQNPDNQIVTDKVWHELAFGLESLGYDTPTIRGRVAEMSSFFGIQTWFYKDVTELSGGQKQLLNLASIMAMQPSVLILDEPTSQLDPIAASDFLATVGKINRELGTTVIMTEHRLEEVFPMSDRVLVMDEGRLICDGAPREVGEALKARGHSMFLAMPTPMRVYAAVPNGQQCPVTVRDGRLWLDEFARGHEVKNHPGLRATPPPGGDMDFTSGEEQRPIRPFPSHVPSRRRGGPAGPGWFLPPQGASPSIELQDIWFKYDKSAPDVLRGLCVKAYAGELLAILGGNGTGKTTALSVIAGINRPYRGRVLIEGRDTAKIPNLYDGLLGVLPQNPQALFVKKTVREDLAEIVKSKEQRDEKIASVSRLCRLAELLDRHPYDLSGGEQQRAALAKVLLLEPRILLLDEPTKGLDAEFKQAFAEILQSLLNRGVTVVMVSHDIEFCAKYAHRCAMFFDGGIVTEDGPRAFFSGNSFYTTAANRMARHLLPGAVTAEDVIAACGGEPPRPLRGLPLQGGEYQQYVDSDVIFPSGGGAGVVPPFPLWRKLAAGVAGAVFLVSAYFALNQPPILTAAGRIALYLAALISLAGLGLALFRRDDTIGNDQVAAGRRRLPRRTVAAAAMILLAIPLTIWVGSFFLGDRKYYFIALLIVLETMLPFLLVFEGRRPQARELVIISVLCAIAVAGRAAFFMLPQFKPVIALVIIAGVAFGGETGFFVGAVTMLVSNIMFGQGPWTPWQMFAMGVIGFLAGVLFRRGLLRRGRLPLCVFGGLAAIVIYGGIMNPANVLMYNAHPNFAMFLSAFVVGFPMDLIQAVATVFFLWFASRPMLEKLDRIKVKYGLVENTAPSAAKSRAKPGDSDRNQYR